MEFQSLLLQINELEEANRFERSKYNEEALLHQNTKTELEKVLLQYRQSKAEIDRLTTLNAAISTRSENHEKIIVQLKKSVKDAKEEIEMLKESSERETHATREIRSRYLKEIEELQNMVRQMKDKATPKEERGTTTDRLEF